MTSQKTLEFAWQHSKLILIQQLDEKDWIKGWKHLGGGGDCCHIVLFLRGIMFDFDHVIIVKDVLNESTYYGRWKTKELKCQKNYI
jgi:hypothetical protein